MYIIDDICYAGHPSNEIRIVDVKPLLGGMLLCRFSSGEEKLFDTTTLDGSAFLPLRNKDVFDSVIAEHGFISWNKGEIDIAPEYVYEYGFRYEKTDDLATA